MQRTTDTDTTQEPAVGIRREGGDLTHRLHLPADRPQKDLFCRGAPSGILGGVGGSASQPADSFVPENVRQWVTNGRYFLQYVARAKKIAGYQVAVSAPNRLISAGRPERTDRDEGPSRRGPTVGAIKQIRATPHPATRWLHAARAVEPNSQKVKSRGSTRPRSVDRANEGRLLAAGTYVAERGSFAP